MARSDVLPARRVGTRRRLARSQAAFAYFLNAPAEQRLRPLRIVFTGGHMETDGGGSPGIQAYMAAHDAELSKTLTAIEIEVWALPTEGFGRFVAAVPPPLSIGTITLADGRAIKGFLVEAQGVVGARDISSFGGWRAFMRVARQ